MIAPNRPRYARRQDERARLMRWFICAVAVFAFAPSAFAQDFDALRGSETVGPATFTKWSGFYFGGQMSYSNGAASFTNATSGLIAYSLRGLTVEAEDDPSAIPVLGNANSNRAGFGGFVGYNTQWEDLVLGLEANYTHSPFSMVASNSTFVDRIYAVGSALVSVTMQGTGSMEITDYGSLRARAGWVFGSNFMPYGFAGFAMGRGSYSVTSLVFGQQSSPPPPGPPYPSLPCTPSPGTCLDYSFSNATSGNSVPLYGFSVGGGVDVALAQNIFLRGEYEYIQFAPIAGITAAISSARIGAGLKF
jgi:outer membrane immunogenic protein